MRRAVVFCALVLVGCSNIAGPFGRKTDRPDDPMLTIGEQQRRGRHQLPLPEDSAAVAPRTYIDRPGPNGR